MGMAEEGEGLAEGAEVKGPQCRALLKWRKQGVVRAERDSGRGGKACRVRNVGPQGHGGSTLSVTGSRR